MNEGKRMIRVIKHEQNKLQQEIVGGTRKIGALATLSQKKDESKSGARGTQRKSLYQPGVKRCFRVKKEEREV